MHPFPARMAPEIALDAIPSRTTRKLTVLDPMCGSGTVLGVALQRGHDAVGVDIDPLAVMMSRLAVTPVDVGDVARWAEIVGRSGNDRHAPTPWRGDGETQKFVDYWFGPLQQSQLRALVYAIERVPDDTVRLALRLAISRLIVTKSPKASLAADTAHSRPHKVADQSMYDVVAGFRKSVIQLSRMLSDRTLNGDGSVTLGDARHLTTVASDSIDLAVTSPPYLNALDYLRGHKLALVWFGHTVSELRGRRSVSIGAERRPDYAVNGSVTAIVDAIERDAVDASLLRRSMLERFATDCMAFSAELRRTLKPGARAVLVVGNSTLRGNYIRNDRIAQTAMEHAGFVLIDSREREIPPSRRYMAMTGASPDSSVGKRMRTEAVLTMERPRDA